jgi:hypothetical protein
MELINRKRFREHWERVMPGLGEPGSALWVYEEQVGVRCRWFLKIRPIHSWDEFINRNNPEGRKQAFWLWCDRQLRGTVLCYSSNDREEWWGFTHKPDVVPFVMKWT